MPTPPLPIPSTVYTGKTISELRSLSSTGTLGLLGNLILAKMEANEIIRIQQGIKDESTVTPSQQKEAEGTRDAIVRFLTSPDLSWTISKLKASLEVEDLTCSAPLNAVVQTGVKTVNSKVVIPAIPLVGSSTAPGNLTSKGVGVGQGVGTVSEPLMMKKSGGQHGGRMTATGHAYIGLSDPVPNSDTMDPMNDFTSVNLYFDKIKKDLL